MVSLALRNPQYSRAAARLAEPGGERKIADRLRDERRQKPLLAASSCASREHPGLRRDQTVAHPDARRSRLAGGTFQIRKLAPRSARGPIFRVLSSRKSGDFFASAEAMTQALGKFSAFLRAILLVSCIALAAICARAQSASTVPVPWTDAANSLAEKITSTVTTSHTLTITTVTDVSAGAPVDLSWLRHTIESEITTQGGRLFQNVLGSAGPAPVDAQVQIAISHNINGYLLVAQIALGGSKQIVVAPVAGTQSVPGSPGPVPELRQRVVWQQTDPILDFAEGSPDSSHTLWYILEPDRLSAYEFSGASQILEVDQHFSRLYTSRDARGRLALTDATHVTAWVAAVHCDGTWNPGFSLSCSPNIGQQWPVGTVNWAYEPSRNFFTGAVTLSAGVVTHYPPFYSAAFPPSASGGSASRWILAGLSGPALLFTGSAQASATFFDWGSDIVSLNSACGQSWQVLVTGPGDWTEPDRIQMYQIADRQATAIGEPLQFPGPILTLWPSADSQSARVVFRNLQTGMYEASILSVGCSN